MTAPKKTDPLTPQEVAGASETFFSLLTEVLNRAPKGTSVEDALKMSESIFALAHKQRATVLESAEERFGFNKKES